MKENQCQDARQRANANIFDAMRTALEARARRSGTECTMAFLKDLASYLVQTKGKQKPDRLASRKKIALICWFCENCQELILNDQEDITRPLSEDLALENDIESEQDVNWEPDEISLLGYRSCLQ
jgi:hypothetical protein